MPSTSAQAPACGGESYWAFLRHAYADHIARQAGVRTAQFLLGHANLATTEIYRGDPTVDELQAAVAGSRS